MPVQPCQENGSPGFKYGESGTCYTYARNNPASAARARSLAEKQGRAIKAAQNRRDESSS